MGRIGQPVRRYTVVPLEEPVSPTAEPVTPPPPTKAPDNPAPAGQVYREGRGGTGAITFTA